ncbi:MAG: diphthine--ammonia ligase [Candidatus Aenigmarchaeota archaeon]|nr:diphthine--ammonia ligase [Candidatus Aenigmarchaeota archaeon]
MKLASLYSGGKDSTYAVWKAVQAGHTITTLVSFLPENPDSYMFHHPNVRWTSLQAEAMGLPILQLPTHGEKEAELADLERALRGLDIDGVTSGALASQYQKSRVDAICGKLGLASLSPAWHADVEAYWREMLAAGFRIIVTKVACDGLGKAWLGREVTGSAFAELQALAKTYRFHLGFEGGEAETFVLDCPLFSRPVQVTEARTAWDGETGTYRIVRAALARR